MQEVQGTSHCVDNLLGAGGRWGRGRGVERASWKFLIRGQWFTFAKWVSIQNFHCEFAQLGVCAMCPTTLCIRPVGQDLILHFLSLSVFAHILNSLLIGPLKCAFGSYIFVWSHRLLIIKALGQFPCKASQGPHCVNWQKTHKRVSFFFLSSSPSIDHGSMAMHAR